jgi:hypothetical protein
VYGLDLETSIRKFSRGMREEIMPLWICREELDRFWRTRNWRGSHDFVTDGFCNAFRLVWPSSRNTPCSSLKWIFFHSQSHWFGLWSVFSKRICSSSFVVCCFSCTVRGQAGACSSSMRRRAEDIPRPALDFTSERATLRTFNFG